MTTKNRRAVGTFGLVAVIAVLAVSMIAMNITSQPILAEDQPAKAAKKAGMTMTNPVFAPLVESPGNDPVPTVFSLGHFDIKSNDKGDWLVDSTIECATAVQTITKGKKDRDAPLEGGFAGAKVWFTLDKKPISIATGERLELLPDKDGFFAVPTVATWNLCEQVFEMKSNFDDLIIDCAEALTLNGTAFPSCEGDPNKLVFLCAVPEPLEEITECEQSLEVFSKVAGTHPAMVLIHDVSAGSSHVVEAWAALDAGATINSTLLFTNQTDVSDNFVKAGVMIGKRIFVAEPIHMQTVTSEG